MCDGAKPPVALQKKSASGHLCLSAASGHLCLSVWVVWVGGRGWKDGGMGGRAGGLGGRVGSADGWAGWACEYRQTDKETNR
jgi:hypothetical protein